LEFAELQQWRVKAKEERRKRRLFEKRMITVGLRGTWKI